MNPLTTARVGGILQKAFVVMTGYNGMAPGRYKISWPWGKLELYPDRVGLRIAFSQFDIPLKDIERVERHFLFMVRIHHRNQAVPAYVAVYGWGLLSKLKSASRIYRLALPFA